MSFSVIGGADGPTSIFFAGTLGDVIWIPVALAVIVVGGICVWRTVSRKKKRK